MQIQRPYPLLGTGDGMFKEVWPVEAMALESIVASVWRFDGFLSVTRYPLRVSGGYSDISMSSACAGTEWCASRSARRAGSPSRCSWRRRGRSGPLVGTTVSPTSPAVVATTSMVATGAEGHGRRVLFGRQRLVCQLADARRLRGPLGYRYQPGTPVGHRAKLRAEVTPSIDLLFRAVGRVRTEVVEQGWGKRYGDPLLDALRELVRYAHLQPSAGGRVGTTIREEVRRNLVRAVFGEE